MSVEFIILVDGPKRLSPWPPVGWRGHNPSDRVLAQFIANVLRCRMNATVWDWLSSLIEDPIKITQELKNLQAEVLSSNSRSTTRVELINQQLEDHNNQLTKLLDERKDLNSQLNQEVVDDTQLSEIEEYCSEFRNKLENPTFASKRRLIDMFDVNGKRIVENLIYLCVDPNRYNYLPS